MKAQGVGLNLHNSSIMDKSTSHDGKNGGMNLPKDQVLISAKESEHYCIHLYRKAKAPTIIT